MTHTHRFLLAGALLVGAPLLAQQPPQAPRILEIHIESVKPGKAMAHEQHEQGWPLAFAGGKSDAYYIAMTQETGVSDAWYVVGYGSWTQKQQTDAAIAKVAGLEAKLGQLAEKDAEFISGARTLMAVFQDSLGAGTVPDFPRVHGWRVTTTRVKFGHEAEFRAVRRAIRDAYTKAGIDPHIGVYQVMSGVNVPTYLIFRPYSSISEMDEWATQGAKLTAQYTPEQQQLMDKFNADGVLSREANTFAVSPKQSYISAEWAAADPTFWKSNPVIAMRAREAAGATQAGKPAMKPADKPAPKPTDPKPTEKKP